MIQEENAELIQRSVEGIIHQEHILERTHIVYIPVPHMLDEYQECISERMHEQVVDVPVCQTVDQPGDQACRDPTWMTADAVRRQSCGCAGTVTGDDSSEESDCGSDWSSIIDGLMAKLLGNAEQEYHQVEEESSSWMGDLAGSSWRRGKSARKWER